MFFDRFSPGRWLPLSVFLCLVPFAAYSEVDPADWGVHKIWGSYAVDSIPRVKGGYIMPEWKDINPARNEFDFSIIDDELERYADLGKPVSIAVRGKYKPDFLFSEVPYHPEKIGVGVHDAQGTLQYWHPTYRQRYRELLDALANHLRSSRHRDLVYSVRMNLNALGTEHSGVEDQYRSQSQWTVPDGVSFVPYSDAENSDYKRFVAQTYHDLFVPDFLVFVRTIVIAGSDDILPDAVLQAVSQGTMGLLHTTSVPEPTSASTERKYLSHIEYGRQGDTPIYAEPYSSSTKGSRGDQPPAQWNYWRILSDLHAGVSYISVYGTDLERYVEAEFDAAFVFANRYAGLQTRQTTIFSPGAWVALRQGDEYLLGDYTFLMSRMSGDASTALRNVGPEWQRFGAWARRVPSGGRMRFQVEDGFADAIAGEDVRVRITYLASGSPRFSLETAGGTTQDFNGQATGTWKTVEVEVSAAPMAGNQGADITINAQTDVTLHMVELVRSNAPDVDLDVTRPRPPDFR